MRVALSSIGLVIPVCWGIFIAWWLATAFRVKRTAVRPGQWWLVRVGLVAAVFGVIVGRHGGAAPSALVARLWPASTALLVAGTLIVVAGLALALWARTVIGRNWSAAVVLKQDHELVDRGPYGVVRHPIYSALWLMLAGSALASGQLLWILIAAGVMLGLALKARAEERLLTTHFPEAYPAYRRRVRGAIVPFVG